MLDIQNDTWEGLNDILQFQDDILEVQNDIEGTTKTSDIREHTLRSGRLACWEVIR